MTGFHINPPGLRFTPDDADRAYQQWGFNCGPSAVAAILGLSIAELRPHLGDFEEKGYTNPTLMFAILSRIGCRWSKSQVLPAWKTRAWPLYGLARIQWEGPWTEPGVPMKARYRQTHWVGACAAYPGRGVGIWDINALSEHNLTGWTSLANWEGIVVPYILKSYPRASGRWHITHSIEVRPKAA